MERNSLWKKFLLLTVGGLLALHINVSYAEGQTLVNSSEEELTEGCVLTE